MEEEPQGFSEQPPDPANPPPQPPEIPGFMDRPIRILPRADAIEWEDCRKFFSITGGSILYCLSAMCVVYGISAVLGPEFIRTHSLAAALPCLGALNLYEIALIAVLLLIVIRHNVTDDAISLVVIGALFLVVSGVALTTVSNSHPSWVLYLGIACFVLAMAKLFVLKRFAGMSISPMLFIGYAVVLGWNFIAGARLAEATVIKDVERGQWLASSLVLLAGAVIVLVDAAVRREPAGSSDKTVPFLRRPAMGWIFAMVLIAAAVIHLHALSYVFDVNTQFVDYMPMVTVLGLIAMMLALRLRPMNATLAAVIGSAPIVVFLFALTNEPTFEPPALGIQLMWYSPVMFGLAGLAVLATGYFRKSFTLLWLGFFYGLAVVLTATTGTTLESFHWKICGALLVGVLLLIGLVKRNPWLCFVAIWVGALALPGTDIFLKANHWLKLHYLGAAMGAGGIGTIAVGLILGRMPLKAMVLGAFGVTFCAFDFAPANPGWRDVYAIAAILIMCAALWLRLNHWHGIVVMMVPVVVRIAVASAALAMWKYVLLGFLLLVAGAWVSIRKGKRALRERQEAEGS